MNALVRPCAMTGRTVLGLALALLTMGGVAHPAAAVDPVGVVIVTDVTPAGRQRTPPSPEQPVYYQAVNAGYQVFARSLAGDRLPPDDQFLQLILRTLYNQGYHPSSAAHPPTVVLGFTWGSLRGNLAGALQFMGGEKLDLMWEVQPGSNKLDPRVLTRGMRNPNQTRVMELAGEDIYVVRIAAYDHEELIRGNLIQLWDTRVAAPARHHYARNALPQIIKAAGPFIGRETDQPQWLPPEEVGRRATVELGELQTVETFDLDHVIDARKGAP